MGCHVYTAYYVKWSAIDGETSLNVAAVDRRSQGIIQPGRSSGATQTSNLHENSWTVDYFVGQGKWFKKLSLSPDFR